MVDSLGKICIVAKGDGAIDVIDIESERTDGKSRSVSKSQKGARRMYPLTKMAEMHCILDYSFGGHTAAAVSCVAFSMFGEKGRFMISGGNDKLVKVWDMHKCIGASQRNSDVDLLRVNINLSRKVNWLCTNPTDTENLVVCDTSKVVKVYTIA